MKFNNKAYDVLKFVALIVLPALAVLYSGLGSLWGFPETDKVVATIVLLDTFLGALLQISSAKFKADEGQIAGYLGGTGVNPDTGIPDLQLTVTKDPNEILANRTVKLKVGPPPPPPMPKV